MYQLKLGLRSLFYRKIQYRSLFLVCMFGVAVSLTAIFINNGMIRAMNEKAKIYYGGNFAFLNYEKDDSDLRIDNYKDVYEKICSIFQDKAIVSYRFDLDARHSSFYFEGTQALQQTIKGCNFELEKELFEKMGIVSGDFNIKKGTNGILISKPIAELLNVKVGDTMTFMIRRIDDTTNTEMVKICGIFQDSSVFGMYTSYMDFDFLKECYGRDENFANRIVVNFPNKFLSEKESVFYQKKFEKVFNMFPLVSKKSDFLDIDSSHTEKISALIPLSANLTDVKIMDKAMDLVVTFIIVMLVLIIVAGIGSTYRVIIMKRLNEIGIYMAIGMNKKSIVLTILFESIVLLFFGCFCGFLLSEVFCFIVSLFDFSFIPAFDIFLIKGHISSFVSFFESFLVITSVIIFTLLAVLYSTWKSIKILPVQALSVVE